MYVARVTELSASSEQGFADAIDQGIKRATSCPTWRSQLHRAEDQGCRVRRLLRLERHLELVLLQQPRARPARRGCPRVCVRGRGRYPHDLEWVRGLSGQLRAQGQRRWRRHYRSLGGTGPGCPAPDSPSCPPRRTTTSSPLPGRRPPPRRSSTRRCRRKGELRRLRNMASSASTTKGGPT